MNFLLNLGPDNPIINLIRKNRALRRKLAKYSFPLFFILYFGDRMTYPTADFQREMFKLMEDEKNDLVVLSAFRGSSKSTVCNTAFAIWAIISGRYHNIILASQTVPQVRVHFRNIKYAFEGNQLLRNDLGPFLEEAEEWGLSSIVFGNYEAKITPVSVEQSIRGNIYKHYRPDLIILDDIEDLKSTRTKESRQRLWEFFLSELIPLGTPHTKIVVLGNFLHEFSLVGTLMREIEQGIRPGVCRRYPLLGEGGKCLWPGMFPTPESIEALRRKIGDEPTWQREYMLKIIESDSKLVTLDQFRFYDHLPPKDKFHGYLYTWIGTDVAVGQNTWNDFTSIVILQVYVLDGKLQIYVLPNPLNKRLDFDQTILAFQNVLAEVGEPQRTKMMLETNGILLAYYQHMLGKGYSQVVPVKSTEDKLFRLQPVVKYIKDGTILFPRNGAQELVNQLIGFGYENFDDMCDALSIAVGQIVEDYSTHERGLFKKGYYAGQDGPYVSENRVERFESCRQGLSENSSGAEDDLMPWQFQHLDNIHPQQIICKRRAQSSRVSDSVGYLIHDVVWYFPELRILTAGDYKIAVDEPETPKVYIIAKPEDFRMYLPKLTELYKEPFETSDEVISWNIQRSTIDWSLRSVEFIIELNLISPELSMEPYMLQMFYDALAHTPGARVQYIRSLPQDGPLRNYVQERFLFMNRLIAAEAEKWEKRGRIVR